MPNPTKQKQTHKKHVKKLRAWTNNFMLIRSKPQISLIKQFKFFLQTLLLSETISSYTTLKWFLISFMNSLWIFKFYFGDETISPQKAHMKQIFSISKPCFLNTKQNISGLCQSYVNKIPDVYIFSGWCFLTLPILAF